MTHRPGHYSVPAPTHSACIDPNGRLIGRSDRALLIGRDVTTAGVAADLRGRAYLCRLLLTHQCAQFFFLFGAKTRRGKRFFDE